MDTKNLTIFFSDMVSFTKTSSAFSQKQLVYLLKVQDSIFLPTIKIYRGQVIKTIGDAYLVVFDSTTNALLCAINIQDKISMHNKVCSKERRFMVRIALNCGDVTIKNGDVFGTPVNIASRVQSLAKPGEIYLTQAAFLAINRNEIPFAKIGKKKLKGIPQEVGIYKVDYKSQHKFKKNFESSVTYASIFIFLIIIVVFIISNKISKNNFTSMLFSQRESVIKVVTDNTKLEGH